MDEIAVMMHSDATDAKQRFNKVIGLSFKMLAGTLDGSFDLHEPESWAPSVPCKSTSHPFVLTR
jgi:hypothetical protein